MVCDCGDCGGFGGEWDNLMRSRASSCNLLSAIVAASIGLLTLIGLYTPFGSPEIVASLLMQIVMVTAALAVLIGILNLVTVHLGRLTRFEKGGLYSLVILATAGSVIAIYIADPRTNDTDQSISLAIFEALQVSLESALAGLMFFFLVYSAYRLLGRGVTWGNCFFLSALLVVLLGWLPIQGLSLLQDLRTWLLEVPVTAGTRALLIGIALGTLIVGLRVLIGQEQAFREK